LISTLWLLAASFVVLLCRGAARADEQMLAANRTAQGRERAVGARITRPVDRGGAGGAAAASRDAVLAHQAQTRAQVRARFRAGAARARGARCAAQS